MESDYTELLEALRWHWGSAFMIYKVRPDYWIALRRDDFTCLRATSPELLNSMMRVSYQSRPVPRDL